MTPLPDWILVALGGGIGSAARYFVTFQSERLAASTAAGTAIVNLLGSFLIGLLLPFLGRLPAFARPLFVVGFLGGFTTMSTYAVEIVSSATKQDFGIAIGLWAIGALGCGLVCAAGFAVGLRWQ